VTYVSSSVAPWGVRGAPHGRRAFTFTFTDPPVPVAPEDVIFTDPPWLDGWSRVGLWDRPDRIHPDAPAGYGVDWGPVGDRYVMRPREAAGRRSDRAAPIVMIADSTDIPEGKIPRAAARVIALATEAGRLGRVTYSLAELPPAGRLTESVVVRWRPLSGKPAGFACWTDGRFGVAMTSDLRRLPARGVADEIRTPPQDNLTNQ
jgi:hypothetical protein